jgi:hypothetical protein
MNESQLNQAQIRSNTGEKKWGGPDPIHVKTKKLLTVGWLF